MAWLPIAYTVPQYFDPDTNQPYSGAVLKAYQVGTTTNIPFATTNEGTTTANSIALNASGYPEVGGNVVIPHLDQDYKLALYPDQASADADSGADWTIDDIDLIQTTDTASAADYNVWPLVDYGGAKFDGSNDYLTRGAGLTGASDGKKGTIVAFVTFDASATAIEYVVHSTGGAFILRRDSDGVFRVIAENSGGSTILNMATSSAYNDTDTVYCVMASWDLATPGSNQLYVNDESDVVTTTFTNDTIDYTVADWAVGADVGGSNKITGNVLSVWFDATDNLDFDTELNRRRFLDEQDNPVFLGGQGELPAGSQPILFLGNEDETSFETNRGSGGDFTENGTLAAASVTFDGQYHYNRFPNVNADVTATDEELNRASNDSPTIQTFTASGTWNRPSGVRRVVVEVIGGGAGGSGCPTGSWGVGGSAGGYSRKIIDVTGISSATVTVGSGGGGGAAGSNDGGEGGNSSWSDGTNTITGNGGSGTLLASGGGTATGGDINASGGPSGAGDSGHSGFGGSSYLGGGAEGVKNSNGANAVTAGAGGSGGNDNASGGARSGGNGADGIVIATEFY